MKTQQNARGVLWTVIAVFSCSSPFQASPYNIRCVSSEDNTACTCDYDQSAGHPAACSTASLTSIPDSTLCAVLGTIGPARMAVAIASKTHAWPALGRSARAVPTTNNWLRTRPSSRPVLLPLARRSVSTTGASGQRLGIATYTPPSRTLAPRPATTTPATITAPVPRSSQSRAATRPPCARRVRMP